jgi:hypothetical protein
MASMLKIFALVAALAAVVLPQAAHAQVTTGQNGVCCAYINDPTTRTGYRGRRRGQRPRQRRSTAFNGVERRSTHVQRRSRTLANAVGNGVQPLSAANGVETLEAITRCYDDIDG